MYDVVPYLKQSSSLLPILSMRLLLLQSQSEGGLVRQSHEKKKVYTVFSLVADRKKMGRKVYSVF